MQICELNILEKSELLEEISVEIDELIGSREELFFFTQELGPKKDELFCISRVFATLKTAQEVARAASKLDPILTKEFFSNLDHVSSMSLL